MKSYVYVVIDGGEKVYKASLNPLVCGRVSLAYTVGLIRDVWWYREDWKIANLPNYGGIGRMITKCGFLSAKRVKKLSFRSSSAFEEQPG